MHSDEPKAHLGLILPSVYKEMANGYMWFRKGGVGKLWQFTARGKVILVIMLFTC